MKKIFLNSRSFLLLIIIILNNATYSHGQDTDSTSKFNISVYIDTYYSLDLNDLKVGNKPSFYYSQKRNNEFNVNLALVNFSYDSKKFRSKFSYQTGDYAAYNYAAETEVMKHIYQASAGFKLKKKVWIDAGIIPSHIGAETAVHKDNLALTRAVMAENVPFYLSGAKISYEGDKLTTSFLVVNGWQNIKETNSYKTIGTFVSYKFSDNVSISNANFYGNEMPDSVAVQNRFFDDAYAVIKIKKFDVVPSAQIGLQNSKTQFGASITTRYNCFKKVSFTGRVEKYVDKFSIITAVPGGLNLYGYSLGLNYDIMEGVLFRFEAKRLDAANKIFDGRGYYNTITSSFAFYF